MHSAIGNIAGRIRLRSEKESLSIGEKENIARERHPAWQKQVLFFGRLSEEAAEKR
jgi:hypothetical protein